MTVINIRQIMIDRCIKLKSKCSNLDCVIFVSHCYTGEGVADIECWPKEYNSSFMIQYANYNSMISDDDWSDVYNTTSPLLPYINIVYGSQYYILVDLTKEEVQVISEPGNINIIPFNQYILP